VSKAPVNFRKADLTRALQAAQAAGLQVEAVNVPREGGFELRLVKGHCDDKSETVAAADAIPG